MYFPYLRGKQFELIALREICNFIENKKLIAPIIEPVKATTVTLEKTLGCLISNKINFSILLNPQVGDFKRSNVKILSIIEDISKYENFKPSIIVDNKTDFKAMTKVIQSLDLENLMVICDNLPDEDLFFEFLDEHKVTSIVINEETISSKRFIRSIKKKDIDKIALTDPFQILRRNVDYKENDNEFFSDEHLYFNEEGYIGYSDYLTIGSDYIDSGFLPYAVAIHLTYFNSEDEFWVRHFVSDTNEDTTDVAGKFGEALGKLVKFIDENKLITNACEEFRELFRTESYPGLGSIKKLSIKHHIELVYNYLNNIP